MSNLGFSIENHYAASIAARRRRGGVSRADETSRRVLQQDAPTPYRLYIGLAMALAFATAYAFPEQTAIVLHRFGAL